MITKYLSELLYDLECVIVPEFGAFIAKECPASVDYTNHRFTPPFKEIVFNGQLLGDDDVLVSYIAENENITKDEAKNLIHAFSMQSMAALESGVAVKLDGIGELVVNANKDIVFKQEEDANFLDAAFGLTAFTMQPIYRSETIQIVKEKIENQYVEKNTPMSLAVENVVANDEKTNVKRNYKWVKPLTCVSLVCMLLIVLGWGTQKSDSNLAGWIPFFYSSPNEFIVSHLNEKTAQIILGDNIEVTVAEPQDVELQKADNEFIELEQNLADSMLIQPEVLNPENEVELIENETVAEVAVLVEPEIIEAKPEIIEVEPVVEENHYFIIGGSFQEQSRAEKCLNTLKTKGFDSAVILDCNAKGYWRVAYEAFPDKASALPRLSSIKSDVDETAWLLFQK